MLKPASKFITLCYDNFPIQREFVFAMKGRPFSMLSSQSLPVPSVSLIDFNLVNDLNLKMSDLQCAKFSFGGQKLRILGRISQTVQTITDGVVSGTMHIRANVVEDLRKTFECHSIAGKKMLEILSRESAATVSPPASQTSPSTSSAMTSPAPSKSPRRSRGSQLPATPKMSVSTLTEVPDTSVSQQLIAQEREINEDFFDNSEDELFSPEAANCHPRKQVPLRPDFSHFYARVMSVKSQLRNFKPTGRKIVEMDYQHNNGELYTQHTTIPRYSELTRGLQVNDAVLFKQYKDWGKATEDGHEDLTPIVFVYNEEEEAQLRSRGVVFPECPPNLLPGGYYG